MSRRVFLGVAGLGLAGTAVGCGSGSPTAAPSSTPHPTSSTVPPAATTSTGPVPMDYPTLASKLTGQLVRPGDAGYSLARRSYNPRYDGRRPAAVALCRNAADVQACVSAAAASRTPIAARSGGHSYVGYSMPDNALVVDLAGLSGVTANADGTVTVGAGTRLIDVYAGLAGAGRLLPGGSCPSVGIAGLTLGGGIGVLGRKYGLTCDRLVAATIVTADGTSRTVSANQDADLFWALRGGGGGNFGVVTSFTFATVPAPPQLTVFLLGFPAGSVPDVFGAWQPWIAAAPDELWSNCNITGGSPSTCTVAGCFVGPQSAVAPLLADLANRIGRAPSSRFVQPYDYLGAMRYFAGCATKSMATCQAQTNGANWNREAFAASSRMLDAPVSDPGTITSVCDGRTGLHLIIDGLGGAIGRVGAADTAFAHRKSLASMQIYLKTTVDQQQNAVAQVGAVRDALGGVVGTTGYVNYLDAAMPDWARAYYGDNLPKLKSVVQQYDPAAVFTFAQSLHQA